MKRSQLCDDKRRRFTIPPHQHHDHSILWLQSPHHHHITTSLPKSNALWIERTTILPGNRALGYFVFIAKKCFLFRKRIFLRKTFRSWQCRLNVITLPKLRSTTKSYYRNLLWIFGWCHINKTTVVVVVVNAAVTIDVLALVAIFVLVIVFFVAVVVVVVVVDGVALFEYYKIFKEKNSKHWKSISFKEKKIKSKSKINLIKRTSERLQRLLLFDAVVRLNKK